MRDRGTRFMGAVGLERDVIGILRNDWAQRGRGIMRGRATETHIVGALRIDHTIMSPSDPVQVVSGILRDHLIRRLSWILRDHRTQLLHAVALEPDSPATLRDP